MVILFPKPPDDIYKAGEQAQVPLLVGWNSQESGYQGILGNNAPTVENYTKAIQKRYGDKANDILVAYHANTDADVATVATKLASDLFIGYSTWRWSDAQSQTSGKPVYRYLYAHPRPQMRTEMGNAKANLAGGVSKDTSAVKAAPAPPAAGAVHSAEIEYAMGNLGTNRVFNWNADDAEVSGIIQAFFCQLYCYGKSEWAGCTMWLPVEKNKSANVMRIDVNTKAVTEQHRDQYLLMEKIAATKQNP